MKLEGIAPCNLGGGGKSNRLPAVTQRSPSVRFHVLRRPLRLTGRRLMEGPQRVRPAGALASARRQAVPGENAIRFRRKRCLVRVTEPSSSVPIMHVRPA
jgi:hypothetical protein